QRPYRTGPVYGRTVRLLGTWRTPLVLRARNSAWAFSALDFAKPDSETAPLRVSTLIAPASTVLSSTNFAFTAVVMLASSTYAPTDSCPRTTAQPVVTMVAPASRANARALVYFMTFSFS